MIVVGAGPAGLAVAALLRQRGLRPTVLERSDAAGGAWSDRWDSLHLHTMRSLSGLPDLPIPRRYGRWVSRDDFVRYLRDYADHFEIAPEFGVRVERVERDEPGWLVHTRDDVRADDTVIIATGYSRIPRIPDWPGRDGYLRPVTHSVHYRSPEPYRGRAMLVVGAGNSATEIAAELAENGASVQLSVRTSPNIVRRSVLGVPSQLIGLSVKRAPASVVNPMTGLFRRVSVPDLSAYGLPAPEKSFTQFVQTRTVPVLDHGFVEHVRAGRIEIVAAVHHLTPETVELADGSIRTPDAVICGTGFTPGLEPMVGHLGVLDGGGVPLVRGAQSHPGAPGLHFVGITVELSGLLHEINLEARVLAAALAS